MAFKINNPLTYINPGKGVKVNVGDFGSKVAEKPAKQSGPDKIGMNVRGSKGYEKALANSKKEVKSNPSVTPKVDTQSSGKQQFDKAISTFKKAASLTSGIGSGKASSVKYPEKPKKTGGYVKKGGTSTGNIKDYKAGTEARRNEYTARGWKQDSTTKINKDSTTPNKPTAEVIKTKGVSIGVKAPKASDVNLSKKPNVKKEGLNKKTNYSKIAVTEKDAARRIKRGKKSSARKEESMKRKAGRIDKAKASGNTNKVDRIKESARRKKARVDAKKKKGNS